MKKIEWLDFQVDVSPLYTIFLLFLPPPTVLET